MINETQDPTQGAPAEQDPMAGISFPMGDSAPSPMGAGSPAAEPANPEQTAQYKQDLEEMIAAVQAKVQEHADETSADDAQSTEQKNALIEQVFKLMAAEGVDLNSPEKIQEFLAEMEQKDPQRYKAFTALLEKIMDPEEQDSQAAPVDPTATEPAPAEPAPAGASQYDKTGEQIQSSNYPG